MWQPLIARKPRTDAQFIPNILLFSIVRNARLVSCDGQLSFWHWYIQVEQSLWIFHKFNASLTKATSHRFVDLLLQSFTTYNSGAMELLPCFSVFAFQIFKRFFNCNFWSSHTKHWCGNQRVTFGVWLFVQLLQPLLLAKERALYYSPLSFQPNPSLTIFSASSALLLQTKMYTTSSFFSKAFEPILRMYCVIKWHHYSLWFVLWRVHIQVTPVWQDLSMDN